MSLIRGVNGNAEQRYVEISADGGDALIADQCDQMSELPYRRSAKRAEATLEAASQSFERSAASERKKGTAAHEPSPSFDMWAARRG